MIFDTHAHYDDEQFDSDRAELLSDILPMVGLCGVVNMGSDFAGCEKTLELAGKYSYVYGAAGIHPECAEALPEDWRTRIEAMLKHEKIVAVGEIGLDYHWMTSTKERQIEVFEAQLELAADMGYPVAVHDREAHGDMLEILKRHRPKGVMHAFSGSLEMAREITRLGMFVGLGGVVTFKNARHAADVARELPMEFIVLETDAPYLSPVPVRGKRNDSRNIAYVAERIAELRGLSADEVLKITCDNARRLYNLA